MQNNRLTFCLFSFVNSRYIHDNDYEIFLSSLIPFMSILKPLSTMAGTPRYEVDWWQVHMTEEDCTIFVRSNNGFAFYCNTDPAQFIDSPRFKDQYIECLDIIRGGSGKEDGIYTSEEAVEWLMEPFRPLIERRLAIPPPLPITNLQPSLAQYLFPEHFVCALNVTNEKPVAYLHRWRAPLGQGIGRAKLSRAAEALANPDQGAARVSSPVWSGLGRCQTGEYSDR